MVCFYFNDILIQILRFAYFPVTNSKEKNSFHRHFNIEAMLGDNSSLTSSCISSAVNVSLFITLRCTAVESANDSTVV